MSESAAESSILWSNRFLYVGLIATKAGTADIPQNEIRIHMRAFFRAIKKSLGAHTRFRVLEAEGDTVRWQPEPTMVVLFIAEAEQQKLADSAIAESVKVLAEKLRQDEIWFLKLPAELYVVHGVARGRP